MSDTKSGVFEKDFGKGSFMASDRISELSPTLDTPALPVMNSNGNFEAGVRNVSQMSRSAKHEKNVSI